MDRKKYHIGFILTVKLGNATRFRILKKYAERDNEVSCIWAPIDYFPDESGTARFLMKLPSFVRWRAIVLWQAMPVMSSIRKLDAVMVHQFEPSVVLSLLRAIKRQPLLVNSSDDTPLVPGREHPMYANELGRKAWLQALRFRLDVWRARRADLTIPMSTWAARILVEDCGVTKESVHPLHVGVDLEEWPIQPPRPLENVTRRLLFVGGDFARKGGKLLLDVHQAQFADEVELHIVSKNFKPLFYRNVFVYSDIDSSDPRLRQLYRDCDIFVLPTLSDLSSWVCLEAMASCRPVISTNISGIADIVKNNENGIVVKMGSAPELSKAISELLSNPRRSIEMGRRGREMVEEKFNAEINVARIISIIKESIDNKIPVHVAASL